MLRPRLLTLLCYGAMMSLAIGVNLLPVFLTSLSLTFGGQDGLSQEQLGRLGAISFIGLVLGILIAGPASDRWGAKILAIAGNGIMVFSLIGMSLAPGYGNLGMRIKSHAAGTSRSATAARHWYQPLLSLCHSSGSQEP